MGFFKMSSKTRVTASPFSVSPTDHLEHGGHTNPRKKPGTTPAVEFMGKTSSVYPEEVEA